MGKFFKTAKFLNHKNYFKIYKTTGLHKECTKDTVSRVFHF